MIYNFIALRFLCRWHNKHLKNFPRINFEVQRVVRFLSEERVSSKDEIAIVKYEDIPVSNIRNFSIIAHIDHGKSTLADRLLEITGTVHLEPGNAQVLDKLQVEKERGITVKAVTATLQYRCRTNNEIYLLNLVDTPGHVDFANEVDRALAACQSVILLVDANQGVQAQTYANFYLAFVNEMIIIPVLNKIDLRGANPELVEEQLKNLFDIDRKDVLRISAKHGTGVENLIEHIIEKAPSPVSNRNAPFKALLFDSWFDKFEGVVIILFIKDGCVKKGDVIVSHHNKTLYPVKRLGILRPTEHETDILRAGQVGYISCNMRSPSHAVIGDTFYVKGQPVESFPEFQPSRPMVFAGLYPVDPSEHIALRTAIEKLSLTDSSVTVSTDSSPALGLGFRLGFLGLLHLEVFNQRLDQEYGAQTIMTTPSVTYRVRIKGQKNIKEYGTEELLISNPTQMPNINIITEMEEPIVLATIITPSEYVSKVIGLCFERRGQEKAITEVDNFRSMLKYILPLNEVIIDFHDVLKNITSGYASFNYEDHGYASSDLVKVDILLNSESVEELCMILHRSRAREVSSKVCKKLTDVIPRQQFKIAIQASVGTKIIARETIKAYRKDVTQKLYGGDATRRIKLLKRQEDGKEKMRMVGKIKIPRDSFIQLLKKY